MIRHRFFTKTPLYQPVYLETYQTGKLQEKIEIAFDIIKECRLCARSCKTNRMNEETGKCNTGSKAWVSSYSSHFGEEAPLVGRGGSGTIFFTHCNLMCTFCQNYDISHLGNGVEVSDFQLAQMMLELQNRGCENINFVTPSHVVHRILSALKIAVESGLKVPLVYNTGGYDNVETIKLLEGVFDIFMPDIKFFDHKLAELTCNASDYPEVVRKAVKEMFRQVNDLIIDNKGIARRGLLIRHLLMPGYPEDTREIMRFIAMELSQNTYVNIMPQYRPYGRAYEVEKLSVPLSRKEFLMAIRIAKEEGVVRLDKAV